jgi:hypothetical protein
MLAAIAVTGLLLAGCSQGNEPTAYDETTEANFIQGCTGEGTGATGASSDYCQCAYRYFVDNVPFDADAAKEAGLPEEPNFVAVNDALEQADDAMPESLEQAIAASCGTSGRPGPDTGGPTTSSTATGTSAPQ